MNPLVYEVTDHSFETAVLERSRQVPVVVDLWAPWCGPCRTLGPLLERLTEEYAGAFELAKVNVDESPGLSQAFGVQSIPMVLGFRDGQIAAEFVGALPESGVREFIQRLLPSRADELAAQAGDKLAAGKHAEAEALCREALASDARHGGALLKLATILAERGESDEALELLERVDPGPWRDQADRLAAQIRVGQGAPVDREALRRRLEQNPDDCEARMALAQAAAAAKQYEEALQGYLEVVRRDRAYDDEAGRKAMLDLFALLGSDHPLTDRYRSELAKVLFS